MLSQEIIGLNVSHAVALDLLLPELRVLLSRAVVVRATMPITSVNENSHFSPEKDKVSRTSNFRQWARGHTIAQPLFVKYGTQNPFWPGISPLVSAHHSPHGT
jgi:hypothetical protein